MKKSRIVQDLACFTILLTLLSLLSGGSLAARNSSDHVNSNPLSANSDRTRLIKTSFPVFAKSDTKNKVPASLCCICCSISSIIRIAPK